MRQILFFMLLLWITQSNIIALENTTCKNCHPLIYAEYQHSMHSHSSLFGDPTHNAVWKRHPAKVKRNYKCASCHTPSDHSVTKGMLPTPNHAEIDEPISCQTCHRIERIEEHAKANKNIYTRKKKYFFSMDHKRKGEKVVFKEERSFLGIFKKKSGSPYHDIDYGNEIYYNGRICLGCHDHKQNNKGFTVCDLEVKQKDSKETCISCHMPQKKGSLANQKQNRKHAFHGISIHQKPKHLSRYIQFSINKQPSGFDVYIKNKATHTLFPQPLRMSQLRVSIERNDKLLTLPIHSFMRIIGTAGKPSMPWLATEVLKDTTIKAHETRKIHYNTPLKKGDHLIIEFGYYLVNPKAAKQLRITDTKVKKIIILNKKRIAI
ncbi:MAG: cytochrome c family protein [Sulfurovum sp.]|nr:cytochrome c family protein [Sulfurovum sp.]